MATELLHGYGIITWLRNYYMATELLHGYGIITWPRNYYMATELLYGHGTMYIIITDHNRDCILFLASHYGCFDMYWAEVR